MEAKMDKECTVLGDDLGTNPDKDSIKAQYFWEKKNVKTRRTSRPSPTLKHMNITTKR